ncbi:MAG: hypothetical protein PV353_05435, partial [Bartonella sp.]|nr:hypothetical protein [Bartonella sp.]
TPSNLLYIPLKRKGTIKPIAIINKKTKDQENAISLGKKAWKYLISLINYYQNPQQGYLSHAVPLKKSYEGDYDHLARLLEWSIGFDKADQS